VERHLDDADGPRIAWNPSILAGKPVIRGTRIPVSLILNLLRHGYAFNRIVQAYPTLSKADSQAAIAYAEATPDREEIHAAPQA